MLKCCILKIWFIQKKAQLPNIQQLKISEQKQTRSGSRSPARGSNSTTATIPKLSALDIGISFVVFKFEKI